MCDQDHFEQDRQEFEARSLVTRRQFGVLLGAGVAMMLPQVVNAVAVTDADVTVTTPDGTCDAYFVHPASGTAPGVLLWPDIFGLRPAMRTMGKRLAESGYSVLVVNPFYRTKKAPTADQGAATPIPSLMPLAQALNETTHMTDAKAFIALAGSAGVGGQEPQDWDAGLLHGRPDRVSHRGCGARSRRRGRVVPRRRARHHQCRTVRTCRPRRPRRSCSSRSRRTTMQRAPTTKTCLKETFAKAKLPAEIEVYTGAAHGWCPPDSTVYNEPQAEKAWSRLLARTEKPWPDQSRRRRARECRRRPPTRPCRVRYAACMTLLSMALALLVAARQASVRRGLSRAPTRPRAITRATVLTPAEGPPIVVYAAMNVTDKQLDTVTVMAFVFKADGTLKGQAGRAGAADARTQRNEILDAGGRRWAGRSHRRDRHRHQPGAARRLRRLVANRSSSAPRKPRSRSRSRRPPPICRS